MVSLMLLFFFFSSRRRHTRFDCDWSSDVCSSDLGTFDELFLAQHVQHREGRGARDRRSEERRVGKSVDLGGRRIIKKKKYTRRGKTRELYHSTCSELFSMSPSARLRETQ